MTTDNRLNRKALIVLSAGRSGTSLLMQVLQAMGLRLSENLIAPQWENPNGFFEDVEIVELHKDLLSQLGASQNLPLPAGWKSHEVIKTFRPAIRSLLERQLSKDDRLWGFKDPRTCSLLPVWLEVMRSLWVTPVFVLAVRRPEVAVHSMIKQAPTLSSELAELIWLIRTCDALRNTSGSCFIAHYEDWFSDPVRLSEDLLKYTGLADGYRGNIREMLEEIIKPNLNRSVHEPYEIKNKFVLVLYSALQECRGANFDGKRLMQTVTECQRAIEGFKGWYIEALKSAGDNKVRNRLGGALNEEQGRTVELEKSLKQVQDEREELVLAAEKVTLKNNEYLKEILALSRRNEELRIRVDTLSSLVADAQPSAKVAASAEKPASKTITPGVGKEKSKLNDIRKTHNLKKPDTPALTRSQKLWRKFRKTPHQFFGDARNPFIRSLRHLFRES